MKLFLKCSEDEKGPEHFQLRELEIKIENLQRIVLQTDRLNLAEKKGKVQEEIEKKTQRLVRKWKNIL